MKYWFFLIFAILFEVSGTTCMKISSGFTRLIPSVLMFLFYGCSLASLTFALKRFDVGFAYAVWSGLGTAIIAAVGVLFFKEPLTALKVIFLLMIIAGVAGLNYSGAGH